MKHLNALINKINVDALRSMASKARQGVACQIPALEQRTGIESQLSFISKQCGGQNCNLDIKFADGVCWVARIRLIDPLLPPAEVQNHIFLSELATLQFLSNTKVPSPQIYASSADSADDDVGVPYMLLEKLDGKPLNWQAASVEQRYRVMEQLTDVYIELDKHPLQLTGSPVPLAKPSEVASQVSVGGFAQEPCFPTPAAHLGPFETVHASYTALVNQQMKTIVNGEVSGLAADNYLAFLWLLAVLPDLISESESSTGPFYLRHYDDKGDHILVDKEYNITGIIDWEFASAEAKEIALSSPCMMWPVGEFYDGSNVLADDELRFADIFERRGRRDLADIVRSGRRWQRYLFFLGGGIPSDMAEFEPLFQGLRKSFTPDKDKLTAYADWKASALQGFAKGNRELELLMQMEQEAVTGAGC